MASIAAGKFVSFHYTLSDEEGDVLQRSEDEGLGPLEYVHGFSPLLEGLHEALEGLSEGEQKRIVITPDKGYGEHDEEGVFEIPRSELPNPDEVKFGDELEAEDDDGNVIDLHVVEVGEESVIVDSNHPLAGVTLTWEVTVQTVRDASQEEIAQARAQSAEAESGVHVHGPDSQH